MENNTQGYVPYVPATAAPKIKTLDFKKSDYIFAILFAVSSVLLAFIGITERMALGYTVSHIAFLAVFAVYLLKNGRLNVLSLFSLIASAASSVTFSLYTGDKAVYLAFALVTASTVLFALSASGLEVDSFGDVLRMAYAAVITPLENAPVALKSLFAANKKKGVLQVLLALAVSIPFLAIVIALLASYDAAFEGLVNYVGKLIGRIIIKLILSVILFIILYSLAVDWKYKLFKDINDTYFNVPKKRFIKNAFTLTFLILISVVYLAFIVSQFAYLFNAFRGLLPKNFTFSEYARRGFFEAEAVTALNLAVMVLFTRFSARREDGRLSFTNKLFFSFIGLFSLFLVVTAGFKMVMYINSYGLTVLRLSSSVFMIATVAFVTAFILKLYKPELKPVKYAVVFALMLFTALSLAGIDRTVASYNVNAYINGRLPSVDLTMLSQLDPDSTVPYIVKLAELEGDENAKVAAAADEALSYICYERYYSSMDYETYFDALVKDSNIFRSALMRSCSKKAFDSHKVLGGIPEYRYFKPPYAYDNYNYVSQSAMSALHNYCNINFDDGSGYPVTAVDNHDGFLGDGTSFVDIQYYDDEKEKQIAENTRWKKTPVPDNLREFIYGDFFEEISDYNIPEVNNGYYLFYDRSDEAANDRYDDSFLNGNRYSYNFTFALYDCDTDSLYYIEADT
jgi:hypothetical protein